MGASGRSDSFPAWTLTREADTAFQGTHNNPSESTLRKVVRIRDAAFFAGSDEHAHSAAALLSLLASAKPHGLDPERYLRDMIRVLPFWPKDRYLELAPKYWAATRATLEPAQLDAEVGIIDVPKSS